MEALANVRLLGTLDQVLGLLQVSQPEEYNLDNCSRGRLRSGVRYQIERIFCDFAEGTGV